MKLGSINKYLLKNLFSYIDMKTQLKLIQYNKKLLSKLEISKYIYQKRLFNSLITPAYLKNPSVFLYNNIFDEETLKKLISDFEDDKTGIYEENKLFKKATDSEIYDILKNPLKFPKSNKTNLLELNLSNLKSLEIPCIILTDLETLSLTKITNIRFITEEPNISLNNLKHLFLNDIYFQKNQKIKINMNNLIFVDVRFIIMDGIIREEEEPEYDDEEYDIKYVYIFSDLENLMNIFNFNFVSVFLLNKSKREIEELRLMYEDFGRIFNKPKELFSQKDFLTKLHYFYFEIIFDTFDYATSQFTYKYKFSKTKNNKYLFESCFQEILFSDWRPKSYDTDYSFIVKDCRLCDDVNYNSYYFIDKDVFIEGVGSQSFPREFIDQDLFIYSLRMLKNVVKNKKFGKDDKDFFFVLDYFEDTDYQLEEICLDYLNKENESIFFYNFREFKGLKTFEIRKNCSLSNKQIIKLLTELSFFKYLFLIDITFRRKLKLSEKEKKRLYKLFPGISIIISDKKSCIHWKNKNPIIKIK